MMPDIATFPNLLPYALAYAARGWQVFPLHTPSATGKCSCGKDCNHNCGKHPRIAGGFKQASLDENVIRAWWKKWPTANIGVVGGENTGLLIIDVDTRKSGDVTWARLVAEHPDDPPTLTAQTGSGGLHVFYQRPKGIGKIKSCSEAIKPGVDCKCDGGYVVAAPSLHFSGNRYAWLPGADAIQPAPQWLIDLLCPPPKKQTPPKVVSRTEDSDLLRRRARAYMAKIPAAISGQGGHDQTFASARSAVAWISKGLPDSEARALFTDYCARCEPPWEDNDIEHKWASALAAEKIPIIEDRQPAAKGDATAVTNAKPDPDFDWDASLDRDKQGTILRTLPNLVTLLTYPDGWQGVLGYDSFSGQCVFRRPPPWHADDAPGEAHVNLEDADDARVISWLQRTYSLTFRLDVVRQAIQIVCEAHHFHPVRDYLDVLRWDEVERLPDFAPTYLGGGDDAHSMVAALRWMIAAVRRVYEPGCQSDSILVLEGRQGIGKSRLLRALASDPWFADDIGDPSNKDAADALRGKWLIEIGELRWRRADEDTRKAFLSRRVDHYRPSYGRRTIDVKRQCVIAGTTNSDDWQTDSTGARRYWAIRCHHVDFDAIVRDRDQLWAEAVARYKAGEPSWLQDDEVPAQRTALAERRESDPWEPEILGWIERGPRMAAGVTIPDILTDCIKLDIGKRTVGDSRRVAAILRRAGYAQSGRPGGRSESRARIWTLPSEDAE